jgi:hypothetical protein
MGQDHFLVLFLIKNQKLKIFDLNNFFLSPYTISYLFL